ncbi:MAG: tRNA (adenosine(37)-N6)-dimethylallyltransferase MiaA [Patescibacteria group bacterium]
MKKLLVLVGPTAIGKTSLAFELAGKFSGQLISADSRQVYQGLNIGTGKELSATIPTHLIDLVKPDEYFSVADWLPLAVKALDEIWSLEQLPIVIGGTGFYVKALLDGVESLGVVPNWELRKQLKDWALEDLQERLRKRDFGVWEKLNQSDRANPRRLIRKIEIATSKEIGSGFAGVRADVLFLGLTGELKKIYQRIDLRVEQRLKEGLAEEIKGLLDSGVGWGDPGMNTLAYKEFYPYFEDDSPLEDIVRRWKFNEHGYARRQLTWFKKDPRIQWFDIFDPDWNLSLLKLVDQWYSNFN